MVAGCDVPRLLAFSLSSRVAHIGALLRGTEGRIPPRRDQAIELLAADAASLPPEFNADVLLRLSALAEGRHGLAPRLLDEAFLRAYGAPGTVPPGDDDAGAARQPAGRAGLRLRDRVDAALRCRSARSS